MRHLNMRLLLPLAAALSIAAQDINEIVRKSLDREIVNQRNLSNYTWETKTVSHSTDKSGKVKKTSTETFENLNIDGTSYKRLIEEDGKPLSERKARREQEKMDKEIANRKDESDKARRKRLENERKEMEEAIKFRREVMEAYTFTLEGEETVNGFACWRVAGEPKTGFKPKTREGTWLSKMHGRIWIEKEAFHWAKIKVETLDKIRLFGFIAALDQGTTIEVQQMRINEELWHPRWAKLKASAHAFFKQFHGDSETEWRNFRKFQAESKIVGVEEVK